MAQADTLTRRLRRRLRVRSRISGTASRPRLSVTVGSRHVSAQLVDDVSGKTLATSDSRQTGASKGNLTERAAWVGADIAVHAKKAKVTRVVFDRNGRQYHGRVKVLAEQARAGGLEF